MASHISPKGKGKEYVIEGVSTHTVLVASPYTGPTVKNGQPRVYLRTKLIPMGTFCGNGTDPSSTTVGRPDRIGADVIIRRGGTRPGPGTNAGICTTTGGSVKSSSECVDRRKIGEYPVPAHKQGGGQGLGGGDSYPITAMCAHPTLHHVVVGFLNDSVSILG